MPIRPELTARHKTGRPTRMFQYFVQDFLRLFSAKKFLYTFVKFSTFYLDCMPSFQECGRSDPYRFGLRSSNFFRVVDVIVLIIMFLSPESWTKWLSDIFFKSFTVPIGVEEYASQKDIFIYMFPCF